MRCPARGRAPSPPFFSARRCRPAAHADHHRDVHDEQGDMIGLGRLIQHRRRTADHGVRERVAQSHTQSADFGREQLRLHDGVDRRVAGTSCRSPIASPSGPSPDGHQRGCSPRGEPGTGYLVETRKPTPEGPGRLRARHAVDCAATDEELIATVFPVVADSAAALAKTRAATPSSNEGEQGAPVRMECTKASSSA